MRRSIISLSPGARARQLRIAWWLEAKRLRAVARARVMVTLATNEGSAV